MELFQAARNSRPGESAEDIPLLLHSAPETVACTMAGEKDCIHMLRREECQCLYNRPFQVST